MKVTITTATTIRDKTFRDDNDSRWDDEPYSPIVRYSRSKVNITGMEGYQALALFHSDDSAIGLAIRAVLEAELPA